MCPQARTARRSLLQIRERAQAVELPFYVVVGLLCGGTSALLAAASRSTSAAFVGLRESGVPTYAMPVIGGLATGSLALICPEIAYQVCVLPGRNVHTRHARYGAADKQV